MPRSGNSGIGTARRGLSTPPRRRPHQAPRRPWPSQPANPAALGTYRSDGASADCYWAIINTGSNGPDIIENDLPGGGRPQVALEEGHDLTTARCG
jgi:hypothetical protein